MAVLLAFCVAAAAFPPVGLAAGGTVHSVPSGTELIPFLAQDTVRDGDTIQLEGDVRAYDAKTSHPWIIEKAITIDGGGHGLTVTGTGILLGADVTFQNVNLRLTNTDSRNAMIANGYTLTLDNVKATGLAVNVFCGTLHKADQDNFEVPRTGTSNTLHILGKTNLQGPNTASLGTANIYAGSLAMGGLSPANNGPEDNGVENTFSADVAINIEDSDDSDGSNALGTVYAGGGQQRIPIGMESTKQTKPDPDKYKVGGTVTISGAAIPTVDGRGASAANVVYRGGDQTLRVFHEISSLSVESGELALTSQSSLRDGQSLSIASGARLNLTPMTGVSNLEVQRFEGNGYLILNENQTWNLKGTVAGRTTVAINSIGSRENGSVFVSDGTPKPGHTYIQAPNSTADSFVLLPPAGRPDITLERDASGNWTRPAQEDSKLESLDPESVQISSGKTAVYIPLHTVYTTETGLNLEDFLTLSVDGAEADRVPYDNGGFYFRAGNLGISAGYYPDVGDGGDALDVYNANSNEDPLPIPDGSYPIQITVSGDCTVSGADITKSCVLTVGDNTPAVKMIPVPAAKTGLKWNQSVQTGVAGGEGYTLSGTYEAADVGSYTATATLEANYRWNNGTSAPRTINWTIARADGPAAPSGLAGVAPSAAGAADGAITGTTSAMEYAATASFTNRYGCGDGRTDGLAAGTYYIRVKKTATHEAGAYASITVPAPGAPTVHSISVNSTAHKTTYNVGEALDVTGLTIEAVYSNGDKQTVPVTVNMVGGFDSSAPAEGQSLTITYEGKTTAYTIKIAANQQPGGTQRQVTVSNTGDGGTAAGTYTYEEGTAVTVQAGVKSGYTFAAWETTGVTLANSGVPDVSFQMPANDVTLHAIWTQNGGTSGHVHAWDPAWKSNGTHHWHDCTASGCPITQEGLKSGYAAHTAGDWVVDQPAFSSQNGTRHRSCTVCGYEMARETIPATGGGSSGGSSSGGSSSDRDSSDKDSSSGGTGSTVKHPDGSTTSTSTNSVTGAVTETTRRPDGSKTVVETKKDGTVTTTDTAKDGSTVKTVTRPNGDSETTVKQAGGLTATIRETRGSAAADIRIPSKAAEENPAGSVSLSIPALPGENTSVTVHTGITRPVSVGIPVNGTAATVACLVNRDGSETILKTAALMDGQITVSLSDGAKLRIRNNVKDFQDTQAHWAKDAIDFVSARELFSGRTPHTFAPDASMSRAMLMTVLARLDGVDTTGENAYEKGMAWAVTHGISDGQNPDGQVTREQFVAMLHRYAGSPAATDRELRFSDEERVGAYAREAVRWALENGILSGYEDGTFVPKGKATRAQAAAILSRYIMYLNQQ